MATEEMSTTTRNGRTHGPQSGGGPVSGQACQSVLETPELLENILVNLPAKSIYGITRVSNGFKDCVATSPVIQEKLFFRLSGRRRETWQSLDDEDSWSTSHNAYMRKRFVRIKKLETPKPESAVWLTPVTLNPCISHVCTSGESVTLLDLPMIAASPGSDRIDYLAVADLLQSNHLIDNISVLDTDISQPTCNKIVVKLHIAFRDLDGIVQTEFHVQQNVYGAEAETPRSALQAALRSHQVFRLWRRDYWHEDGGEWAYRWVRHEKLSEFIESMEEIEDVTAVVGCTTSFVLCDTMIPTEAQWAAVAWEEEKAMLLED